VSPRRTFTGTSAYCSIAAVAMSSGMGARRVANGKEVMSLRWSDSYLGRHLPPHPNRESTPRSARFIGLVEA
jgi:hypothetical protein